MPPNLDFAGAGAVLVFVVDELSTMMSICGVDV
jgi:hypothetical protein